MNKNCKKDDFNILIIKPDTISDISWYDPSYPDIISKLDSCLYTPVSIDNIVQTINNYLDLKNVKNLDIDSSEDFSNFDITDFEIKNQVIAEFYDSVYELLYIDFRKDKKYANSSSTNELATLLTINGDTIYYNAIVLKNHLPPLGKSSEIVNIERIDISNILHNRVYTKVVLWDWDNGWKEETCIGDLMTFANNFFENASFKKLEIGFLAHNINIWYIEESLGENNICGTLLSNPLEKCLWFTMISEEIRGNLTLDEVKKIICLSKKLDDHKLPEKYCNYENKTVYTRFRVLEQEYRYYV
jgi:hypothetical protein